MSKKPFSVFLMMGMMMLPVGIVMLLVLKQRGVGITFLVLSIAQLLSGLIMMRKDKE
jgi:hypothetical protein